MSFLDTQFIEMVGARLARFHATGETTYAFRCPFCGDSKKSPNKTRGYIYKKDDQYHYKCFNCPKAMPFWAFLKEIDETLYAEYQLSHLTNKYKKKKFVVAPEKKLERTYDVGVLKELHSIESLDDLDVYKQYVLARQIPTEHLGRLFYCDRFNHFVNTLLPDKIKATIDEPRLVIPFFDQYKKMFAFAGRSFKAYSPLRYINIVLDENNPKLFGIERWDKSKETIVVEGPLDSLFLQNCIATAGGDLVSAIHGLKKENFIIVYDNEPRSKTTRAKIEKAIDYGYRVCIWPRPMSEIDNAKDINAMVLAGRKPLDIQRIICDSAFSGLKAHMELTSRGWFL